MCINIITTFNIQIYMFSALNVEVCFSVGGKGLFVTLTSKYLKLIISDANFNVQQLNRTKTFIFGESKILLLTITRVYVN